MAVFNRYTQAPVAYYNPMSFNELAFAPTFLRQRHDTAAQQLSDLETLSQQYDVLNQYQPVANQLTQPLQQGIESLANELATKGIAGSRAIPEAMKLKSQYSSLFSPTGGIGQLQSATKNYRDQVQEINKFFEKSPELARYITGQLAPGQASLQDGQLQVGQMNIPTYVQDIPESEILKDLNDAASKLKASDFGDLGITNVQGLGNGFDQVITLASQKGVTGQRAMNLITGMVGQDRWNSILQRGAMMGMTPEQTQQNFLNKLKNVASSNAYVDTNLSRMKVTDELSLARAKQQLENKPEATSWDYDPTTQEVSIGGFDDSYFNIPQREGVTTVDGEFISNATAARHGVGGTPVKKGEYKPFSPQQQLEAFEIISSITGTPVQNIPQDFINTKKGREILKKYFDENKGKVQVQPTIDNTNYLREYGGDPDKATKDLYANYPSRILFDVKEGKQLTPKEFEEHLEKGKLEIKGAYSSENPFGFIANNATPASMATPLAVNLKDDDGKIIKTFAISRSPQYQNTTAGFYDTQFNSIYNSSIRTPNINKSHIFTYVNESGNSLDVPIQVKYNPSNKQFSVSSSNNAFKSFNVSKVQDIADGIKENAN